VATKKSDDYDKLLNRVGKNIARLRKARGFTLSQLAYRVETEKANLVRIEQAQTNPTLKTLWKIALALEVDTSEFLKAID
jgi:transcriptional regulator with XRE-family HTH domain